MHSRIIRCEKLESGKTVNFESPDIPSVDVETRTITGLALPYGVPGNTSGGKVSVDAGAVGLPSDLRRIKLLRDHDRSAPVGYLESVENTAHGLVAKFKVGSTPEGDAALVEAAEGIRDGLSVELSGVTRSPDGLRVTVSTLDAVALVAVPAFADARVSSVKASKEEDAMYTKEQWDAWLAAEAIFAAGQASITASANANAGVAQAPQGLTLTHTKPALTFSQACQTIQAVRSGDRSESITAALSDITRSANPWVSNVGWVGELWSGVSYERAIVPLLTPGKLDNWKVTGWRWITKPAVASYAGDKAAVPSNAPTTESVSVEALRLAGAHDIDRKFIDFNDTEFMNSYFAALAESYAYKSDQAAGAFLVANGTTFAAGAVGLLKAVALAANKVKIDSRTKATFVLVNPTDFIDLINITSQDVPAFLQTLGIDPANFQPSEFVAAGTVLVGAKPAVTFYELAGTPIRVDAVNIVNGGYDAGVFGYYAPLLQNAKGLVKATFTAAA